MQAFPIDRRLLIRSGLWGGGGLALSAARISVEQKLAMADSIIYTIAQQTNATLWTQDAHFEGLPGVNYIAKP